VRFWPEPGGDAPCSQSVQILRAVQVHVGVLLIHLLRAWLSTWLPQP
jgi:hypothetical protein